ncbi:short chain dehydrogenase reductase [Pseudovirgaria hyperparasitica]|uniref:Short chain dehydrogenase reductase n=1 Tax=Pseudovirgaria hyperparasitica TaxID=470096 RepID=A0A6A6W2K5_9PEZI|nr:short chain dehydrogenase reductase [Pseudovirgaria hyperparasitica]KAF2757082.1 short chain dehydrogenase reductase [Pseudovirgaria hyperparasitica]
MPAHFPAHVGQNFTPTTRADIYPPTNPLLSDLSQPTKTVLITGASRNIGRSIALRYAEASVSRIVLVARGTTDGVAREISAINPAVKVLQITADISEPADVERAGREFSAWAGADARLDVLINNAGVLETRVPLCESEPAEWWKTWEVSIRGTYMMLRTFVPFVVATAEKRTGVPGTVINMSSIGAHVAAPRMSAYQSSRFAVLRLSEFVEVEYGARGVNVHSLHPGAVATDMTRKSAMVEEAEDFFIDTPELAAGFLVWLTHKNRSWLNGRYLNAEWDVDELEGMRKEIEGTDKLKMRMVV